MPKILVIHGPNLNLLGKREPEVYGTATLGSINEKLTAKAHVLGLEIDFFQSNHEGLIIDRIHGAMGNTDCIIINPGGLTHTSISLRDAIAGVSIPTIEAHLSNIHKREDFRQKSYLAGVCVGQVLGFGENSYYLALEAAASLIKGR